MKLPVYKIQINLDDKDDTGMTAISLVDYPAVEVNYLAFDKQKNMQFAVQDEMEHKITGCAIYCDKLIYRYDPTFGEYYVVFDKQTIEDIVLKYSKQGLNNMVDLQHDGQMIDGAVMIEYYIKNTEKGICPQGFEDVSDGSLFVTYQITDDNLWNEIIKEGSEFRGFSIEITADTVLTDQTVEVEDEYEEMDWLEELLSWLENDDDIEVLFASSKKKVAEVIDQSIDEVQELKIRTKSGKTVTGYVYTTWTVQGSLNMAVWDGNEWHIINETNIKSVEPTINKNSVNWIEAIGNKEWTNIIKIINNPDNENITKIATVSADEYERALDEHKWVMCTYNDETGNPCLGQRQILVMEIGYTTNDNKALRVYETFGATHSEDGIPAWRTLRIDRITSFRINDILEPATYAPDGFREIDEGEDLDGFVCLKRSDLKRIDSI